MHLHAVLEAQLLHEPHDALRARDREVVDGDHGASRLWVRGIVARVRLRSMDIEKIKVRAETGQLLEVVVLNKRADHITVVLGEGVHSVKCDLSPTRNGLAYAGSVMGRELVYERSREQVQADIDRLNPTLRQSTRKR